MSAHKRVNNALYADNIATNIANIVYGRRLEAERPKDSFRAPSSLTEEEWEDIFNIVGTGNSPITAWEKYNMSRAAALAHVDRHEELAIKMEDARSKGYRNNLDVLSEISWLCVKAPRNVIQNIDFIAGMLNTVNEKMLPFSTKKAKANNPLDTLNISDLPSREA